MKRRIIPNMFVEIQLSDRLYDLVGGLNARGQLRVWGGIAKSALTEELVKHHEQRIPLHFKQSARSIYNYQSRSAGYMRKKAVVYRSRTDLVKSGRSEMLIERSRQIRIIGGAASMRTWGSIVGQLIMRFPFPVSRDNNRPGRVKIEEMKREITATTAAEQSDIAYGFLGRVEQKFTQYQGGQRTFYRSK